MTNNLNKLSSMKKFVKIVKTYITCSFFKENIQKKWSMVIRNVRDKYEGKMEGLLIEQSNNDKGEDVEQQKDRKKNC